MLVLCCVVVVKNVQLMVHFLVVVVSLFHPSLVFYCKATVGFQVFRVDDGIQGECMSSRGLIRENSLDLEVCDFHEWPFHVSIGRFRSHRSP